MPRPSGSRITIALPSPIPRAKPSIHALYAAVSVAPPAEYCAQSRNGTLYATSTGTLRVSAAAAIVLRTDFSTSLGEPSVNHTACGVVAIAAIRPASRARRALSRSKNCFTAPGLGGGTNSLASRADIAPVVTADASSPVSAATSAHPVAAASSITHCRDRKPNRLISQSEHYRPPCVRFVARTQVRAIASRRSGRAKCNTHTATRAARPPTCLRSRGRRSRCRTTATGDRPGHIVPAESVQPGRFISKASE